MQRFAVAALDKVRCNADDGRQQESRIVRDRLIAPSAGREPLQEPQKRYGISFGEDRLLGHLKGRPTTVLGGGRKQAQLLTARQRFVDRTNETGNEDVPISCRTQRMAEPLKLVRCPVVLLCR